MPVKKKIKRVLRVGREESSSLSSFVERPVPSTNEVNNFERVIGRELREREIDSNLSEIYSDPKGERINVKKMKIKKRPLFLVRLFKIIFVLTILVLASYLAYFYLFSNSNDISSLDFKINSPAKVLAGETFSYQINYHNPTKYPFTKLHLELQYPNNFIFESASVKPSSGNSTWNLPDLKAGENLNLTITGRLIALPKSANVIFGHLSYLPSGFSSQFKKDASASTIISGLGFDLNLNSSKTAFLNQNNDLILIFSNVKNNYLGNFDISFSLPNYTNASVVINKNNDYSSPDSTFLSRIDNSASSSPKGLSASSSQMIITPNGGVNWKISGLYPPIARQEVHLEYKVSKASKDNSIIVRLGKKINGKSYIFWEKKINPQLIKSDLNLALSLNGSENDGAVNFGQKLNYSITYSNHSSNSYKDIVIMAVVKGDFLDWNSVQVKKGGIAKGQTIIWTKNEDPALALIKPGDSGTLDFSLNLSNFKSEDFGKKLSLTSYSQYSMNAKTVSGEANKSNTITSKINSNLSLNESIRYFDSNNLPVGSGPLPPSVGQKTSFRVYWVVKNSLHELTDARVVMNLPAYVSWDDHINSKVGSLYYNNSQHQVVWAIGRLPVSIGEVVSSFDISITPQEKDRNKILILSSGSKISAMDTVTTAMIYKSTGVETTKLEKDSLASLNNSGIVQ